MNSLRQDCIPGVEDDDVDPPSELLSAPYFDEREDPFSGGICLFFENADLKLEISVRSSAIDLLLLLDVLADGAGLFVRADLNQETSPKLSFRDFSFAFGGSFCDWICADGDDCENGGLISFFSNGRRF